MEFVEKKNTLKNLDLSCFASRTVNRPKDVIGLKIAHCMTQYTDFIEVFFNLKMSHFLVKVNDKSSILILCFRAS